MRNVPSAFGKAPRGFASSPVYLTRIVSDQMGAGTNAGRLCAEIAGHLDGPRVELALQRLRFFSSEVRVLGVYPPTPTG